MKAVGTELIGSVVVSKLGYKFLITGVYDIEKSENHKLIIEYTAVMDDDGMVCSTLISLGIEAVFDMLNGGDASSMGYSLEIQEGPVDQRLLEFRDNGGDNEAA